MNQTAHLYRVQKLDLGLDQNLKRIHEIDRILDSDKTIHSANNRVRTAKIDAQKAHQMLREIEENSRFIQTKIQISEGKLYGGKISNPKELQDIQNEIAALKRHLSNIEDEQLEAMIALENCEQKLKQAETDLAQAQADFAQKICWTSWREKSDSKRE